MRMLLQNWIKPILLHVIVSRKRCHYKIAILRKLTTCACLSEDGFQGRPGFETKTDRDFNKYCPQKIRHVIHKYINRCPKKDDDLYKRSIVSLDKKTDLNCAYWCFLSIFFMATFKFCFFEDKNKPRSYSFLKKFDKTPSICKQHLNSEISCH